MQTMSSIADLISRTSIRECWREPIEIYLGSFDHDHPYLQVKCPGGWNNVTGKAMGWSGRKWVVSIHATDQEVVGTIWMAVKAAVEHEMRELFLFDRVAIFDPHHPLEAMLRMGKEARDSRPEPAAEPPKAGGALRNADYSSIEARVLAFMAEAEAGVARIKNDAVVAEGVSTAEALWCPVCRVWFTPAPFCGNGCPGCHTEGWLSPLDVSDEAEDDEPGEEFCKTCGLPHDQ